MSESTSTSTLPNIPATWGSAFSLYKYSREAMRVNLWTIIGIWVLGSVLNALLQMTLKDYGQFIGFFVSALASVGYTLAMIAGVRRQQMNINEALDKSVPLLLKRVGLSLLTILAVALSLIAFVIPFFFVLPRLALANYYLVDQNLGVIESLKASWNATEGHALKIWGIYGVFILMTLLMITIIGIPFAIYMIIMYSAVFAVIYEFINKTQPKVVTAPKATQASTATPAA